MVVSEREFIGEDHPAYVALMAGDVDKLVPIEVEEDGMPEDTKQWVNLLRDEFASFKGWLAGADGQGGLLNDIKADLVKLELGQRQIEDRISSMVTAQIRDRAETDAKIAEVKQDVNEIGSIARSARDGLGKHCEDMEAKRKFRWETLVGVAGVVAGALIAVFGG